MESKDWISLTGIISTLIISLITIFINYRRELRQEKIREEERKLEHQTKIDEKKFELRYAKLQEKRAAALSELYEQLSKILHEIDLFSVFIRYPPTDANKPKGAWEAYEICEKLFAQNRLYFTEELADQISSILSNLKDYLLKIDYEMSFNDIDKVKNELSTWVEKKQPVVAALKQIEVEFRNLLGSTT